MSKPRYAWWGYMINIIRRYPERRQALAELRHMKVTVNYEASGHGGGGGANGGADCPAGTGPAGDEGI